MTAKSRKRFEIHTAAEWIRDYGAGAENYVAPTLDATRVPKKLRSLVQIAAEWGIADDVTRNDKLDKLQPDDLKGLCYRIRRHKRALDRLIDEIIAKDPDDWTDEDRCFVFLGKCYCELSGTVYWMNKRRANKAVDPSPLTAPRNSRGSSRG